MNNVKKIYGDKILFTENQYDVLKDADALLIVTEWSVFRTPDFDRIGSLMKAKVIFDGRNLYDLQKMIDCGFYYNSIGRRTISI
jgi:UDPglucose 6-dehydrogenase